MGLACLVISLSKFLAPYFTPYCLCPGLCGVSGWRGRRAQGFVRPGLRGAESESLPLPSGAMVSAGRSRCARCRGQGGFGSLQICTRFYWVLASLCPGLCGVSGWRGRGAQGFVRPGLRGAGPESPALPSGAMVSAGRPRCVRFCVHLDFYFLTVHTINVSIYTAADRLHLLATSQIFSNSKQPRWRG